MPSVSGPSVLLTAPTQLPLVHSKFCVQPPPSATFGMRNGLHPGAMSVLRSVAYSLQLSSFIAATQSATAAPSYSTRPAAIESLYCGTASPASSAFANSTHCSSVVMGC